MKSILRVGAMGVAMHVFTLIPPLQSSIIQGIAAIVFAIDIFTQSCVLRFSSDEDTNALGRTLFGILAFTFLFNAVCMLFSAEELWTLSVVQSMFYPAVLAGFIGHAKGNKLFSNIAIAMTIIAVAGYSLDRDTRTLSILAAVSYALCMIIPATIQLRVKGEE